MSEEDDDIRLVRASASLLDDLEHSLPRLLWKAKPQKRVHQLVRKKDLNHVLQLIEPFQPEPQLLDARLKLFLPVLVDAYLSYLQLKSHKAAGLETLPLDVAVSSILYTFCKVRGEKVISGFFNNEPRYLDLILTTLETCTSCEGDEDNHWETSYVLLLWLKHLLLAPFDLASISAPGESTEVTPGLHLASHVPSLTTRVLAMSIIFLGSATKEQDAASELLARLVVRPDMQRLGLPDSLVRWAVDNLVVQPPMSASALHRHLGLLRFCVGMSASPDSVETLSLIPLIYEAGQKIAGEPMFTYFISSAITKKLLIKLFRNIALLSLRPELESLSEFFEDAGVLENTIDYLLQALGDRDTPVRFAASKALSMIILRLDPALASDVVQAVLDCMKEDVPDSFSESDFSTVDPLRWHGLTLTLAHALFRRSASTEQLPEIINALLLSLTFEQRGTTRSSIGSNVRDAACFGIWSFSRRYTTAELLSIKADNIRIESGMTRSAGSVIQIVAMHLLLSACLDPVGNIRRGSSAALQELIGRHPDQIECGIPLVQVVDYHAVGLRQRAAIEVSGAASSLDPDYRRALVMALFGWRGIGSPDVPSREYAATSIGLLCKNQTLPFLKTVMDPLYDRLSSNNETDVENLHGLLLALSRILGNHADDECSVPGTADAAEDVLTYLASSWKVFDRRRAMYVQYDSRALRADLFSAVAQAIASAAELTTVFPGEKAPSSDAMNNVLNILACMVVRAEESILAVLPRLVRALMRLHLTNSSVPLPLDAGSYMQKLRVDSSAVALHGAGRAIALAAAYPWFAHSLSFDAVAFIREIGSIVQDARATEWRVIGLRAMRSVIESGECDAASTKEMLEPLHTGLNDYTVTERGDVGSLVRTAAIACVDSLWKPRLLQKHQHDEQLLLRDVTRLSLEKLDRTRLQAARCLKIREEASQDSSHLDDVSSSSYYHEHVKVLKDAKTAEWQREVILEGCASSAGVGAENLLQAARTALVEVIYESDSAAQIALLVSLTTLFKTTVAAVDDSQPLLELVSFLLDAAGPILLKLTDLSWRNLLSAVQRSHFKSSNIPKILAAIEVYRNLASVPSIRPEVLKKLVSMLRTNPYPTVRVAVAESLFVITGDAKLKDVNWTKPGLDYRLPDHV
ncbi:hypothetical protein AAFC00_006919 [Neodothiora populina]|uniref:Tubulin-specific chaperone D C-terminal domain-containing protein n=1 Tax=Neodothiora populina TaxID=2781224 RepID=A0ABR3PBV4_9PEZI